MYFLIYSSYAKVEFTRTDLKRLLAQSREKNKKMEISGMLLFLGEKFIQLLEGEEVEVKSLYNTIYKDNRHESVVLLKEGFTENRLFTGWAMALSTITPEEIASGEGFEKLNSASALQIFKKLSLDC